MFHCQQVLAPAFVDALQQDLFFDLSHGVDAVFDDLLRHGFINLGIKTICYDFFVHTFFGCPCRDGQVEREILANLFLQAFGIPLIRIGFWRDVIPDHIVNHVMAHLARCFGFVGRFHNVTALREDHFPLLVHHVIVFQHVFTHVEIACFNFALCAFQRFVHPRVDDGFAVFHAEFVQHFIQSIRPENTHQVVF